MTTLIPTAIVLLSLAGFAGASTPEPPEPAMLPPAAEAPSTRSANEAMESLLGVLEAAPGRETPWERVLRSVFVVPGPDLSAEGLAQITEDMAVMCRILDRTTTAVAAGGQIGTAYSFNAGGVVFVSDKSLTRGLYLDGYGALFFIDVDFPVAPSPEEQPQAEPPGDSLWSATVDELRGAPQQPARTGGPQYDARRVESLKLILTKTLRHASNLRVSRAADTVAIVITSHAKSRTSDQRWTYSSTDSTGWRYGQSSSSATGAPSELAGVMILRTSKADVDAFAQGTLTEEQFKSTVEILMSWSSPGQAGARLDAPPAVIRTRSQTMRR